MVSDERRLRRLARASIAARLLLAALVITVIALPLAGLALTYQFRAAVTTAFDERLESLLNVVLASVAYDAANQRLTFERALGDARFDQVYSGWYWQISDGDAQVITSRSLWDQRLPVRDAKQTTVREVVGPRRAALRLMERDITLSGLERPVHVSVAASRQELDLEVARFQRLLTFSLLGLGGLLMLTLALQVRWGLAPLRRMRANLRQVEAGYEHSLDTALPNELSRLAAAMNAVLERDRRLVERSRHAAGNLAHALKTPLSVMRLNLARLPQDSQPGFAAELSRIDVAVRHHLARASAAGDRGGLGSVALSTALAPLIEGLGRLAKRRRLTLECDIPEGVKVAMDEQDLQELVGNLLDNALRWARWRVDLKATENAHHVLLTITDDGPGMTDAECQAAMARGARLDDQRSGTGLGLAIVADLVRLYDGSLALGRSHTGGLAVTVRLPQPSPHQ